MRVDPTLIPLFLAVAEERNFRAAADRLGVTRSAVSQGMRRLEDALGVSLVNRTTRSVHLTEAGAHLHQSLAKPWAEITSGLEVLTGDQAPAGLLRLAVTSIAEPFLSGPLIGSFVAANPAVTVDVTVTDEALDIVSEGFDAGIRLGDVIEQDMIAVPVGKRRQREAVVASPAYIAEHGAPSHPRELVHHRCIGWRPAPNTAPYRWEFEENGVAFTVAVEPQITTNDLRFMLRAALSGAGITFATEETFSTYVNSGELILLLDDYLPTFPGFFLYYPERRNLAPKLRALIDHIKTDRWNGHSKA